MKKLWRWLLNTLVILLLLGVAALLTTDAVVKKLAERRLLAGTGMAASIGEVTVKLGPGVVRVKNFKLLNGAEFGGAPLIEAPEMELTLDRKAAWGGRIRFNEIHLHLKVMNLVRNKDGKFNVQRFAATSKAAAGATPGTNTQSKGFTFGGIEKLYLTLDKLQYTDLAKPEHNELLDLDVKDELVVNLDSEKDLHTWYGTLCVRLLMQALKEQMNNNPDHTQSFEEMLKELSRSFKDL
jgi:hypothetical protein